MKTENRKLEKLELFESLFQTFLKLQNQLTEENNLNNFHSLMRGDSPHTIENITSLNRKNLGEILNVSRRKNLKHQLMATAKQKFQRLDFNPANQKVINFLDELPKLAKDPFGVAAEAIIALHICQKASTPEEIN